MHRDQIDITAQTARRLVDEQFPQWSHLRLHKLRASGTVNALFRLGDEFALRFPLQREDVDTVRRRLRHEADAAAELCDRTRVRTPAPVGLGRPGADYPLPWSVQTWVPGSAAGETAPTTSAGFARELAAFVSDVRALETGARTFTTEGRHGRGGRLDAHDAWMATCFDRSEQLLDVPRLRRLWSHFRELPRRTPDAMTHGDLIPPNMLLADDRLVGIIDVGGVGPADPSLDLICAWQTLDRDARATFRTELGCDDLEWERGKAWAFEQAMGLVWYYAETNPMMSRLGRRTLERILTAPE